MGTRLHNLNITPPSPRHTLGNSFDLLILYR
jgi:hypothetical protein